MESQPKIILASQSIGRREVVTRAGMEMEIIHSNYEEINNSKNPDDLARMHALGKAKDVADRLDEGIVIGVDTIVVVDGLMVFKPEDEQHAYEIIEHQQGKQAEVVSGLAMIDLYRDRTSITSVKTDVSFHAMANHEIEWYISTGEWQGKSGAFSVNGYGSRFIESVNGDYLSVIGIPIQKVYQILKNWGYTNV